MCSGRTSRNLKKQRPEQEVALLKREETDLKSHAPENTPENEWLIVFGGHPFSNI